MSRDGWSGYDGDAVIGNATRPGRAGCECHFGPSPVHNLFHVTRGGGYEIDPTPEFCQRSGTMHDGWFICGRCVRHAPQLRAATPEAPVGDEERRG